MPATMRVAVYHNNADIRIEERRVPEIGPGEVLVHIRASGICGSDVMEWYRVPKAPLVLGHEFIGRVVAVGRRVVEERLGTGWVDLPEPTMGSEDFAYYLERAPGAMFYLGMGEESPQLHNACYDFNDAALKNGIHFLVAATLELLAE